MLDLYDNNILFQIDLYDNTILFNVQCGPRRLMKENQFNFHEPNIKPHYFSNKIGTNLSMKLVKECQSCERSGTEVSFML